MKNIRQFKYQYDINGKLVFRLGLSKDANPILMGKPSIDAMDLNAIPEQAIVMPNQTDVVLNLNTGIIQEPVFFRPESVLTADSGVMDSPAPEISVAIPQEIVQENVVNQTRPDYQKVEISVPGMEVDNSLNSAEDSTIAQAIDSELKSVAAMVESTNVVAEPEQKLYTPAEFTAGTEAAKEEMPAVKSEVETSAPDFVGIIVQTEAERKNIQTRLDSALEKAKSLVNEFNGLQTEVQALCDYMSRETSKAKEAYDRRGRDNAAILGAVNVGIASLNTVDMNQTIAR